MDNADTVSVIIPIYKVELYLDRCITSVVNQTYTDLEIILVDDGSPDHCPVMCDNWARKDSRILVVHKKNGGLSDARNAGMAIAKGAYISFVDSDDYLAPDMLEKLVSACKKDNSDIAACTVMMVWENSAESELLTVQTNCILDRLRAQEELINEKLLKHPVWYKLYKRETVYDIPFETGKFHEDVFWSYQAIGRANQVSLIDSIGYYYVQRLDSIMGAGYSITRLDALEALERRYEYISREFPSLKRRARMSILSSCIYNGQMALKYLDSKERKKAFIRLEEAKNKCEVSRKDYEEYRFKRKIWYDLSRFSLPLTCWLRNVIRIGF